MQIKSINHSSKLNSYVQHDNCCALFLLFATTFVAFWFTLLSFATATFTANDPRCWTSRCTTRSTTRWASISHFMKKRWLSQTISFRLCVWISIWFGLRICPWICIRICECLYSKLFPPKKTKTKHISVKIVQSLSSILTFLS